MWNQDARFAGGGEGCGTGGLASSDCPNTHQETKVRSSKARAAARFRRGRVAKRGPKKVGGV